jgi:HPt (histidine-containing phosphotransfer) domain-containing protein
MSRHLSAAQEPDRPVNVEAATADMMERLRDQFVAELPVEIDAMERAMAAGAWGDLRRRAHAMKGVAGSLGMPQPTRLAQPVEAAIVAGEHTEPQLLCARLLAAARNILESS